MYVDIVEVEPPAAPEMKTGLFGKQTIINLGATSPIPSERFAATKKGKRYNRQTEDRFPGGTNTVLIYKCPRVLAMSKKSNTAIVIDIDNQRVYLMINGMVGLETQVSTARADKITPRGNFKMTERVSDGKISNLYDVEMPFWMRLGETEFGVHAGFLPGYPASAGCIRLPEHAAKIVFENTQRGSAVQIHGKWRPANRINTPSGTQPRSRGSRPAEKPNNGLEVDSYGQTVRRIQI